MSAPQPKHLHETHHLQLESADRCISAHADATPTENLHGLNLSTVQCRLLYDIKILSARYTQTLSEFVPPRPKIMCLPRASRGVQVEARDEIDDLGVEHEREREELLYSIRTQSKELQLWEQVQKH